jgi:hypothetical protein
MDNNSSTYMFEIQFDNDTRAALGVIEYDAWQFADYPCGMWQGLYLKNDPETLNFSISYPLIDGKKSQIISTTQTRIRDNKFVNGTGVQIWLDSKKIVGYDFLVGKTKVEMILLLPENLTRNLLDTFHIEKQLQDTMLETRALTSQPASIIVRTQTNRDPAGVIMIPQIVSKGPSYVVVFDEYQNVLGYENVADGMNKDVEVKLNETPQTQWLYATLNDWGAIRTKYWQYPFLPDAKIRSNKFFDSRIIIPESVSPKTGMGISPSWLDIDGSTSSSSPFYNRQKCINQMMDLGYPPDMANIYCD